MSVASLEEIARAICSARGYTFERKLGEGAFKEVFLVTSADEKSKAVKVLRPGLVSERTEREVEAMTRCHHENIASLEIVSTIKFGEEDYVYLVEEFISGGTLDQRLQTQRIPRDSLLVIGTALIDAIGVVAANDLVHRDIKPANIL